MVFEGAIDRGLHPGLWRVTPGGETLSIDLIVARARERYPDGTADAVSLAPVGDRAWTVDAGGLTVFVDPYTGTVKGTRTFRESQATLSRRLHVLHVELLGGRAGRAVVGAVTMVAFFLALSGIVLWWPDRLFRISTSASWKRINFDLHHALGSGAALVIAVITASGLVIHYPALTRVVRSLDASPPAADPAQPSPPAGARVLPFDALAAAARRSLPGARITFISAGGPRSPAIVAMRYPEDHTPGGRSRVFVDRYRGNVLATLSTRTARLGTRIDNLKRSLHTGDIMGKPTQAVWLLASLVLASQVVTGFLMWWNGRRGRR